MFKYCYIHLSKCREEAYQSPVTERIITSSLDSLLCSLHSLVDHKYQTATWQIWQRW
ncbi:unnamed protein product [Musa acuminata var. zebrina]